MRSFQKTLKEFNPQGKVFCVDMDPFMSSASQVADGFAEVPRVSDENYIDILKKYVKENNISIIVPTIDTELSILAEARDEFLQEGVLVSVSSKEICDIFYLKDTTERFFLSHGFDTPKGVDIYSCDYPVFAKLNNSSCSIGASVVETQQEAEKLAKDKNYIFQEYIKGDEYTVDVFIDKNNQVVSVVPRLRIEVRSGEVSKAKTIKDFEIIQSVKQLCSKLKGAYGCITVQLFKSDKKIYFIEINPRFGGGYPLSYLSGANFAKLLIQDYLDKDLVYDDSWRDNLVMLRYDAEVLVDGSSI